jgi:alpha-galactosidase
MTTDNRNWILETAHSAYALGINDAGYLVQRYWGARLPDSADYPPPQDNNGWASFDGPGQVLPEAYPAWGRGLSYIEPCLKATFADGVRGLDLRYEQAETSTPNELVIHLHDAHYPLRVSLHFRTLPEYDLIERWVRITNEGETPITLERVLSAQWHPPAASAPYRMTHLTGHWFDEWNIRRDRLPHGTTRLESRRIATGHQHNPWCALDAGEATEDSGEVWYSALAWSGSWALLAEATDYQTTMTRVSLGINDWDFAWQLAPGETFDTPACIGGYTSGGFGAASRALHDYIRERILPHGATSHPVLYNSWEATYFQVSTEGQSALAEIAAQLGVELFVMDDGWFKGRNWDNAGLGDWTPDAVKFPHGLMPLIEKVNALGMRFGIWVEPEMVNPDSDLYRAHPDWVIHFPNRERTPSRNQLMLNLARTDVQDHIIGWLDDLLRNHNIAFVKWDHNRNVSEPGWSSAEREPRELWVRYVQGAYRILKMIRERHAHVIVQSCSGGGGRSDLGILRYTDQLWVSDNTEATARIGIQEGFSQIFPANVMEAWVTDMWAEQIPLDFRFAVSMCGTLGIGSNLLKWNADERAIARRWIAFYKEIRDVVQLGDQYRLLPAQGKSYSAVQYMRKDASEGVLFAFRTHMSEPAMFPLIRLRGLQPEARYEVEGIHGVRSGAAWMRDGLRLPLMSESKLIDGVYHTVTGDYQSAVRRIKRVTD